MGLPATQLLRSEAAEAGQSGALVRPFDPRLRDPNGWRLLELVAESTGVAIGLLLHQSREAEVALARQLAMYLMNVAMRRSFTEVGRFFRRDRTTVSHACGQIEDLRDDPNDPGFEQMVATLEHQPSEVDVGAEASRAAG